MRDETSYPSATASQQVRAFRAELLGSGDGRRHDLDAGMSLGEEIAFIELEPGAGRAVEQGGIDRQALRPAPKTHARPGWRSLEVCGDERLHFRHLHAGGDHRDAVGDDPSRAIDDAGPSVSSDASAQSAASFFR
jgi:hypothetical protein